MGVFVINEWLWADARGDNGKEAQRQVLDLIIAFPTSEHSIVVIAPSRFDEKLFALCKATDQIAARIAAGFYTNIRINLNRCIEIAADDAQECPQELFESIKDDDRYLVQAQCSVPDSVIVTTDQPLIQALINAQRACLSRAAFLSNYFGL